MFASEEGDPERIAEMISLLQTSDCVSCQCHPLSTCVTLPLSRSHSLFLSPIRNPGEDTKMLVCDMCDKGYHTFCLQPAMDSLPTNGWRCKVGKDEPLARASVAEPQHTSDSQMQSI